ncbi:M1 family metallopeptidase [Niabella terrae]
MMYRKIISVLIVCFFVSNTYAQQGYWQQRVKYQMDINMDVTTNQFTGTQKLEYWNQSPDTLDRVFYHLYWNAFQPGSMMDQRSRRQGTIQIGARSDWDPRVRDRISQLKPDEIGYQKVTSLKMNGVPQKFEVQETILVVPLTKPILPGQKVVFEMAFNAQVPLQIRRSGRDNPLTEVRYSMSQWYPKMAAYDRDGWHPDPYVGREFYGDFGDFDVNITIDKNYILGGTGYLQNPETIGHGYEPLGTKVNRPAGDKLTWRFHAPKVHDFMWAADPEFVHRSLTLSNGLTLHLLYKLAGKSEADWEKILYMAQLAYPFMEQHFGAYPYKQYSFITGGDGGMEYPMATLLASPGAWLHEWFHSWYQGVLATNESTYAWMDEGFTTYAEQRTQDRRSSTTYTTEQIDSYQSYFNLVKSQLEEPLTTHADHFNTNAAYSVASYSKGAVFLEQLGYIVGAETRDKILLEYYRVWKFKHPTASDFIRLAEKVSHIELDWYQEFWVSSTKTIDYAIDSVWEQGNKTLIRLRNDGQMPMPVDVCISDKKYKRQWHNIPLDLMYGAKTAQGHAGWKTYPAWKWTQHKYVIETDLKLAQISSIEIDPSQRMADVERKNNLMKLP